MYIHLYVCMYVCDRRQYFMDERFWARYCNATHDLCSGGAFSPSGVLLKAVLLHSGQQVRASLRLMCRRDVTAASWQVSSFNGRVALGATPDDYQGYGRVELVNALPLENCPYSLFVREAGIEQLQGHGLVLAVSDSAVPLKVMTCPPRSMGRSP